MTLVGCGEEPSPREKEVIEATLPQQMTDELKGLTVADADCVYLSPTQTRCFARGSGPAGPFELPVFVGERAGRPVWEVDAGDVVEARTGKAAGPLPLGRSVTVVDNGGARVRVSVTRLTDPLERMEVAAPPEPGHRYVGVRLAFRNVGSKRFVDTPHSQINLRLSNGALLAPVFVGDGRCQTLSLLDVRLDAGERIGGCVAFEVPERASPERVSLGIGSSHRVFEWDLAADRPPSEAEAQ